MKMLLSVALIAVTTFVNGFLAANTALKVMQVSLHCVFAHSQIRVAHCSARLKNQAAKTRNILAH